MTTYPTDITQAARQAVEDARSSITISKLRSAPDAGKMIEDQYVSIFAAALMAERERAAQIADDRSAELFSEASNHALEKNEEAFERQKNAAYDAKWVAAAIRKGAA